MTDATADFNQRNLAGVRAYRVEGELLDNGNFIFSWIDGSWRKMVLTSNTGTAIKDGYVSKDATNYKDTTSWKSGPGYYLTNFKGPGEQLFYL